jgi:hypothetical protein
MTKTHDKYDKDTPSDSTFPSKTITIADMILLQSKFGTLSTINVIAKVSSSKVDLALKVFIRQKINFVKKGVNKRFKDYTEQSLKEYLLSPYRTTEGNLKNILKSRPRVKKSEVDHAQGGRLID